MNPLAEQLNAAIRETSPGLFSALSALGRELFFPRGILTQTAEAREKAHRYNATIGIAKSGGQAMHLPAVMRPLAGLSPDEALDYAPSTGNPRLRARWLEDMLAKNPALAGKKTSLPVVTSGITHGLTIAGEMFCDPGDVVILPDKFWGNYNVVYGVRRQASVRKFRFFDESGAFDTPALEAALSGALDEKGKAIVVLNFPNNPTGYSIRRGEAAGLVEALEGQAGEGREVVVVLDDAYFGLFYDEECLEESLFGMLAGGNPHLHPVKLDGATKEEYAWGLRVGFITFAESAAGAKSAESAAGALDQVHEALEKKAGGAVRGNISNCSQLSQSVLLRAMNDPDFARQKREKYDLMRERARTLMEVLRKPEYALVWEPYPFNAGYFMSLRLKGVGAEELRVRLLERYGVGVIAEGSDVRVAFSCLESSEIEDLFDIMHRCATELTSESTGEDGH